MPHTGYVIPRLIESGIPIGARVFSGDYFDCGTPREYLKMLDIVS
jgi:UTP-glucose-1-phosphate uridylyltransferase